MLFVEILDSPGSQSRSYFHCFILQSVTKGEENIRAKFSEYNEVKGRLQAVKKKNVYVVLQYFLVSCTLILSCYILPI